MKIKVNIPNIFIVTACALIIIYFGIKIYQELAPKSYEERQLDCLNMGNDGARIKCLDIIKN